MSFRLSKFISVILLSVITSTFFYGSTTFLYLLPALIFCLSVATCAGFFWLVKRGTVEKSSLPKTGLEFSLILFLTGVMVSTIFSPSPRIGLERIAWFVAVCILFYMLVDLFTKPSMRSNARIVLVVCQPCFDM